MSSRTLLGIFTIGLLAIGGYLLFIKGDYVYAGGFLKSGFVTAALWLALPQLTAFFKQTPRWLLIAGGIGVALATMNWQLLILIVPIVAAVWFFAPRLLASAKAKLGPTISAPPPARRARRKREAE